MKLLVTAVFLLTLASCQGTSRPTPSVDEEKFARVFATLVMISSNPRASAPSTPEEVLKEANMTREEFRKIVADYNRDPQKWGSVIEKVQKIVEEEVARSVSSASSPGDSVAARGVTQSSR